MKQIQNKNFQRRFSPDRPYLIAVSGGRDSVVLLHWLIKCGYKKLIVCHLNHQLRGRAGDADARFVEKLAADCDLEFAVRSVNVRALATKKKLSIEAAAREARYQFFACVAKQKKCCTIFIGHHADDLVETFLINLFRGSGTSGLGAIRESSKRRIGGVDLTIVRPFLGMWRNEIDRYIRAHRLKFREDASNNDLTPLRNRIRHRVIPYLEKALGRNIRQSIWRTAMIAAEEETWIESQLPDSTNDALPVLEMRDLPIALQRRQIMKWLRAQNIADVGFDVVESVRALLNHDLRVAKVNLPRDQHVRRRARKIFITD
ncbi:MAG TPA: tRNA lysidine(34) synthetase TilS [Chthoniobacterales bacterium]|nr:tRNA lysidine(34) synthetase TilS [Chthoniobacterales bacterium]